MYGHEEEPTKEVLEYLELRQELKDLKRKELRKEIGTLFNNGGCLSEETRRVDISYGSFFGPSQPLVLAPRLTNQQSKSSLRRAIFAARKGVNVPVTRSGTTKKIKGPVPSSSAPSATTKKSRSTGVRDQNPKVVSNGLREKIRMLKYSRDYSFLSSDDDNSVLIFAPKTENSCVTNGKILADRKKEVSSSNGIGGGPGRRTAPSNKKVGGSSEKKGTESVSNSRPPAQATTRKKHPRHEDEDDEESEYPDHAISMIRRMFGYNPGRYMDKDDDSDMMMETNFEDIMREEKRSARIAQREDAEELRKTAGGEEKGRKKVVKKLKFSSNFVN